MGKFLNKLRVRLQETTGMIELAEPEVAQKRLDVCLECPSLTKVTKQCKECGCFVVAKTKFKTQKCPIGKW